MILLMFLGVFSIRWFKKTDLPYTIQGYNKKYEVLKELYEEYCRPLIVNTNRHYRTVIENDMGFYLYFYKETQLNDCDGKSFGTIRLILIDEDLSGDRYCVTLAHEMMHLKKMRNQENYICFETFKYLYESSMMHNTGVWYAIKQLEGAYKGEYNISNQIVDYLTNK